MKNTLKQFALASFAFIVGFSAVAQTALAAGSFNPQPSPWGTGILSAAIEPTNTIGISDTAYAQPGDIVALNIYYHNNGNQTINNVRVKFSPRQTGSTTSQTFTGMITGDFVATISDTTSVNISSSQTLTFIPGSVRWFPNQTGQTNTAGQTISSSQENDLVGGNGFNIGPLTAGWPSQGGIVAKFQVSSNGGGCTNCDDINVETSSADSIDQDSAELVGDLNDIGSGNVERWFEWDTNENDVSNGNGAKISVSGTTNSTGEFSKTLSGLDSDETYYFRACAEDDNGDQDCGLVKPFTTDDENGGDNISVTTESAEDIDEDSALLVGDLNDVGSGNTERWFEWSDDQDDVQDGDGENLFVSGDTDNEGEFSKRLSGLDSDERYYFRACAEDDDGNRDCGSVKSFTTDDENNDDDNDDAERPDVTTLNAIYIGSTTATVDGFYDANGCSVTTYFEYGRTSSLGSRTVSINRGNGSGSMAYSFSSLAPNTTYYYRAVGTNCEGVTRGTTKSFTTGSSIIIDRPPVVVSGGGSGNSFIKLTIDNHRETVRGGTEIGYDVSWENITTRRLTDLVLEINFPTEMVIIDTDRGSISRDGHSVIYEISDLTSRESGEMTITTEVVRGLEDGDPVVAQAIMAFENPTTQATENAIAYDSDEFSERDGSILGASLFGLGFLPGSLAGWLLILLIILIIIILARHFMAQNQNKVTVNTNPTTVPPAPNTGASGNDYIVYRPNPLNK